METVSILVPVYNVEKYLDDCLKSLTGQTYKDLEIILVNDGSTDNSLAVAKKWQRQDPRIKIVSQHNAGISHTRNKLLSLATGDWVLFCDSDDWLDTECISALMDAAHATGADLVQCGYAMDLGPVRLNFHHPKKTVMERIPAIHDLVSEKNLNNYPWGKLYRRSLFSGVTFPEEIKGFEDTRTIFKTVLNADKVATIPPAFVHYRLRSGSLTNSMSLDTVYGMREAYRYQERVLKAACPTETFHFDRNQYNTDMVLIYTLIVFSKKQDHPVFIPWNLDWDRLPAIYKPAYKAWLDIACLKFGWKPEDVMRKKD